MMGNHLGWSHLEERLIFTHQILYPVDTKGKEMF